MTEKSCLRFQAAFLVVCMRLLCGLEVLGFGAKDAG